LWEEFIQKGAGIHNTHPRFQEKLRMAEEQKEEIRCAICPMRLRAEEKPNSLIAKIWRWHTGWCPGWKAYQKSLAEEES
jgi:hypothetical protein